MKTYIAILSLFLLVCFGCQNQTSETNFEVTKEPLKATQNWESMGPDGWVKFRKVEYSYNEKDLLIEEKASTISGDTLVPAFRLLRSYNNNGDMIRITRETWANNSWNFAMRSAFIFHQEKIVQRIDSVAGSNAPITFHSYKYDKDDQLLEELGLKSVEGNMVNHSKVTYRYDDRGLAIEKQFPRWSDGEWVNARKMDLVYNDAGHHTQTTRFNWSEGQWVQHINYLLEVNEDGTRQSELWQRSKENGLEDFMRITYTYKTVDL